jgi:hypothetical protein
VQVREARVEDYAQFVAVCRRNELSIAYCDSFEEWRHIWVDNPAHRARPDIPMGWVVETEDNEIVGVCGNLPRIYEWKGRPLAVSVGCSWAADPSYRNHALFPIAKHLGQKGVDLLLATTANHVTAQAYEGFKAQRVPHPGYEDTFLWVFDYPELVDGMGRLKHIPWTGLLKYPAGAALWSFDKLARRNRLGRVLSSVRQIDSFDERFDEFWEARRAQSSTPLAVRDRETLNWQFKYGLQRGGAILVLEKGSRVLGYAVLVHIHRKDVGLRMFRLADLQVLDPDPTHVRGLMTAALRFGRQRGAHMVEVMGLEAFKRQAILELGPYHRKLPNWPLYYKVINRELRAEFKQLTTWELSLYDGDSSVWNQDRTQDSRPV